MLVGQNLSTFDDSIMLHEVMHERNRELKWVGLKLGTYNEKERPPTREQHLDTWSVCTCTCPYMASGNHCCCFR